MYLTVCNTDVIPPTTLSANVQQIVDGLSRNISTGSYRYARSWPGHQNNRRLLSEPVIKKDLLPEIRECSDYFVSQQDGAPAHRARETVALLSQETPDFIPPLQVCGHPTA